MAESLEIGRFYVKNLLTNGKQAMVILVEDSEKKVKAFIVLVGGRDLKTLRLIT